MTGPVLSSISQKDIVFPPLSLAGNGASIAQSTPSVGVSGGRFGGAGSMTTRLTGGSRRGRVLRTSRSSGLRPTSERVRAAVFSMIGPGAVEAAGVLDLYAGTGALGIEGR